jgi:hypothetical protein
VIDEVAADFRLGVVRTPQGTTVRQPALIPVETRTVIERVEGNGSGERAEIRNAPPAPPEGGEEVWDAVKTLLQLRDYLQSTKQAEAEAPVPVEPGSRNQ